MSQLFITVLNMSLTASYVILFVMIIRLGLKKAPKVISYALWVVVAFRLVIPFSFESMFSLMPQNVNTVPIPHNIIYEQNPRINSGILPVDTIVNGSLPAPAVGASANPMQIYIGIASDLWIIGMILLLIYSLVSVFLLKRQLKNARLTENNFYEADNLKTPFVLGIISPKIYLPVGLSKEERQYIHLHEQTHIRRKDHIIKILAFMILTVHWFNPLVWIAFMLMSMDMELSCDERVLKKMNVDIKKSYANSLLSLAAGRRILNGSPLAFGEGNVRGRIKNVLNYKKPRFWMIVAAVIVVAAAGIGLLTNPVNNDTAPADKRFYIMTADDGAPYGCEYGTTREAGNIDTLEMLSMLEKLQGFEFYEEDASHQYIEFQFLYEKPKEIYLRYITEGEWQTEYPIDSATYKIKVPAKAGTYSFFADITWNNQERETVFFDITIKANESSNYDKISAYLKEECIKTFSPYYELMDFIISYYHEEVVSGNVEAVFHYKMIDKNYDRDPDTVEYIKEAKERGDENYQQLYDEYLKPKESNFYFKAVIDENGEITLYTKNPAIDSDEWQEVKMSDYIIK